MNSSLLIQSLLKGCRLIAAILVLHSLAPGCWATGIEAVVSTNGYRLAIPNGKAVLITAATYGSVSVGTDLPAFDGSSWQRPGFWCPGFKLQGYAPALSGSAPKEEKVTPLLIAGPNDAVFFLRNAMTNGLLCFSIVPCTNLFTFTTVEGTRIPQGSAAHFLTVLTSNGDPLNLVLRVGTVEFRGYSPSAHDILPGPLELLPGKWGLSADALITFENVSPDVVQLSIQRVRDISSWGAGGVNFLSKEKSAQFFRLSITP